jgi:hypothetical protein
MTAKPETTASIPWSSGVHQIAAAHGIDRYLLPILEMTHRVFSAVHELKVQVEDDAVTEDDWRIVFAVEVSLPIPRAAEAVGEWYARLFEYCPPPDACFFRLGVRVAE